MGDLTPKQIALLVVIGLAFGGMAAWAGYELYENAMKAPRAVLAPPKP